MNDEPESHPDSGVDEMGGSARAAADASTNGSTETTAGDPNGSRTGAADQADAPAGGAEAEDNGSDSESDSEIVDFPEDDADQDEPPKPSRWANLKLGLKARSTHRALLLVTFGGLFIAGMTQALPEGWTSAGRLINKIDANPVPSTGAPGNESFNSAKAGDCLSWPASTADVSIVDCADDHRFEVAQSIDLRIFPGKEFGPNAAPPSDTRVQEISQEQCRVAITRYLGPRYDPNSRFTIGMLWSGAKGWSEAGERRVLCGLQLPGPDNQQQIFRGKVGEQDQSNVWPDGTCLGIDAATNLPTELPVDCAQPHAMEVTGTVSLAEHFPGEVPPEPDQDAFIKESCTQLTNDYMGGPEKFRASTLTLSYNTIMMPSWIAGSRQVGCNIGSTLGNGAWSTLVNDARSGQLLINGQPPVPPPDIPADRLEMPPIPLTTTPPSATQQQPSYTQQPTATQQPTRTQQPTQTQQPSHTQQPTQTQQPSTPATSQPTGNTIIEGPPPGGPPMDGPPMDAPAALPQPGSEAAPGP